MKLIGPQIVMKFSALYEIRRFIIAFTEARHLFRSSPRPVYSIRPNLILHCHLHLGLASGLFPTDYSHQIPISYQPYLSHAPPISFFLIDHPNNIWCKVQITKLLIMQYSPVPCYLVPFSPEHLPQYPILKHPQYMLLPQCEGTGLN